VLIAEIAGHRRVEAIRRYSLTLAQDREQPMDRIMVDY
jgi:hypothetical protein